MAIRHCPRYCRRPATYFYPHSYRRDETLSEVICFSPHSYRRDEILSEVIYFSPHSYRRDEILSEVIYFRYSYTQRLRVKVILDLGLIDYEECYKTQREMVARRRLGEIGDTLMLAEHNNVFTVGRAGGKGNLLADEVYLRQKGIKVLNIDRGGDITFHGPGQLVVYPIIELKEKWRDLHKYMRNLEDVVMKFLKRYSVRSCRKPGRTGVWASGKKVASIGIGVSNWVTYHGLSININPDLEFFNMIYPCGLRGVKMASLKSLGRGDISIEEAKDAILLDFDSVFNSGRIYFVPTYSSPVRLAG